MRNKKLTKLGMNERRKRIEAANRRGLGRQANVTILRQLLNAPQSRGYWEYTD